MTHFEEVMLYGRKYRIQYAYAGEWLNQFPSSVVNMVQVHHIPESDKSEKEVIGEFESVKDLLLSKIREHIEANMEKFEGIKVVYRFRNKGVGLSPFLGRNFVTNLSVSLDTSFKEAIKHD